MLKNSHSHTLASFALAAAVFASAPLFTSSEIFAQQAPAKKETPQQIVERGLDSLNKQKYDEAIEAFNKLRQDYWERFSSSQKAMLDYMLATAFYQKQEWNKAQEILENFLKCYPKGTEDANDNKVASARISLADVYMRQKNWSKAREMLDAVRRNPQTPIADKMRTEVVMADVIQKEAEAAGDEAKIAQALATAENLLKIVTNGIGWTPEAIEARQRLVQVYIKAGKRAEAEALKSDIDAHIMGAANQDPASVIRSNIQGLALGDTYFGQALDASDDEARSTELFRQALSTYQRVLRKDALVKYFEPAVDAARKKLEKFKEQFKEGTEPNDAQAAQIEKFQEELDEVEGYKTDFEDNKDYDALISFRIGACLFSLNRPWEAYVAFADVVDNHKGFEKISLATYYYIRAMLMIGKTDDAQKLCKEFLTKYSSGDKKADELGEVALMLGQISFERGDYKAAIDNFEWARKNVQSLSLETRCELDWYIVTSWFARCPWGIGVTAEDVAGMGKADYVPKLTKATQDTIDLIDKFLSDYSGKKGFGAACEEMQYRKGLLYFYSGFYKQTVEAFTSYLNDHPNGQFSPDARYRLAIVKYGARYKDKAKDQENLEQVFVDCKSWLKDYFELEDKDILNTFQIAKIRENLTFDAPDIESVKAGIERQRPEIYTLLGDAYKRIAEGDKSSKKRKTKLTAHDIAVKEKATNDMLKAYILAAKTARYNEEALTFVLEELDKVLPQRGEYDRLLDVYTTLYDWNPDAPAALGYLKQKIMCTERAARSTGDKAAEAQAKIRAKKILADAILKNFNDPRQDNVEKLMTDLAYRLARGVKRHRVRPGEVAPPPAPGEYTAEKAADEMVELLKLRSAKKPSLIGQARGSYARAEIYRFLGNEQERQRYLQTIASTFKADELSPTILGTVGDFLAEKGNLKEAEEYYRYLMDNYRSSDYADYGFYGYGKILLDRKEYRKAYEVFNDAIENQVAYAKEADIRLGRAQALINMSEADARALNISKPLDRAYSELNMISSVKEWRGMATAASLFYKGQIEEKRGKPNEAINQYRICYLTWKKYPEFGAKAMLRTGILLNEKLGQPQEAAKIFYEMNMPKNRYAGTPEAKEAARYAQKLPAYTPPQETVPAGTQK